VHNDETRSTVSIVQGCIGHYTTQASRSAEIGQHLRVRPSSRSTVVDHWELNKSEHSPETGTKFAYLNIIILGILNEIIGL
jgi:hypothetical protein